MNDDDDDVMLTMKSEDLQLMLSTHVKNKKLGRSQQFASDARPFSLTARQTAHKRITHL